MSIDDPEVVRREDADERRYAARVARQETATAARGVEATVGGLRGVLRPTGRFVAATSSEAVVVCEP